MSAIDQSVLLGVNSPALFLLGLNLEWQAVSVVHQAIQNGRFPDTVAVPVSP